VGWRHCKSAKISIEGFPVGVALSLWQTTTL
jgi:hypothetical protein